MKPQHIILGGKEIPVQELNFAQLKRLLPAINRVSRAMAIDVLDDSAMDDMALVLYAATGIDQAEIDAMPIKGNELVPAFVTIVNLAGLGPKEGTHQGEALVASDGTGTNSMLTSPPVSAGPGETSTS